jgi:uncharacterized protein YciI
MKSLSLLLAGLLTALASLPASAADERKPEAEMGRMQLILLSRATGAKPAAPDAATLAAQRKATDALLQSGALAFVGDTTGDTALREVLILRSAETNAARELAASLPAVKSGAWTAEPLTWFTATNYFKPAAAGAPRTPYVFGLLLSGTNAAKLPPEEVSKIQEGHMANIRRLAEAGKLAIAGPFAGGGNRRGVFIFNLDSTAEAQKLADTDPAVIAGRLRIELWPIEAPAGILR